MMYNNNCFDPIVGNSLDVDIDDCNSEIRADVVVKKTSPSVRLWGQIKDCDGYPISNALIKLVKVIICHGSYKYEGIAHTVSDCNGFYQFDLCSSDCRDNTYKVIVGKSIVSNEKVVDYEGNCDVCSNCDICDNCNCCNLNYNSSNPGYCFNTNNSNNTTHTSFNFIANNDLCECKKAFNSIS